MELTEHVRTLTSFADLSSLHIANTQVEEVFLTGVLDSVVVEAMTAEAKAKAKAIVSESKAKAKATASEAEAKAKDLPPRPRPRPRPVLNF